ncbi:hypothetical protein LLG90_03930 [Aromatoleum toluclasticum]|nr:hypothetical protein [Aromatoleum toluclasticum]
MKRLSSTVAYVTSWLTVSVLISHLWVTKPEMFPSLPAALWNWADSHYHAANAEEVGDLEFLVTFTISSAVLLLAWVGIYRVWRRVR